MGCCLQESLCMFFFITQFPCRVAHSWMFTNIYYIMSKTSLLQLLNISVLNSWSNMKSPNTFFSFFSSSVIYDPIVHYDWIDGQINKCMVNCFGRPYKYAYLLCLFRRPMLSRVQQEKENICLCNMCAFHWEPMRRTIEWHVS